LGRILKQQRVLHSLTLREVADRAGFYQSILCRIEREQRNPSARILLKIVTPLGLNVDELFMLAGYLSNRPTNGGQDYSNSNQKGYLDPSVAFMLSQQPVSVQRAALSILSTMRYMSSLNNYKDSKNVKDYLWPYFSKINNHEK
jgi:transcriptional regulator with XRE-family HTH domain